MWQVRASYDSKPYRRYQMETYGGVCHPSPVGPHRGRPRDAGGRPRHHRLARHGHLRGGRGRGARTPTRTTRSAACSTTCCCTRASSASRRSSSSTRSSETRRRRLRLRRRRLQPRRAVLPVHRAQPARRRDGPKVVACEPAACPSLTQGEYRYDHGDVAGLTPLLKMHTLGKDFVPPPIHAGGLRYHGMAPMVSHALELGLLSAIAIEQDDAFRAGVEFARAEGIIPAPESTHAVAGGHRPAPAPRRPTRRSSSACPATACSTCPPTRTTSDAAALGPDA